MPRALAVALAVLGLAAPAQAGFRDDCHTHSGVRQCEGMVESFDGTPLDATLTLPAKAKKGKRLPLVVFIHGLLTDKREYISDRRKGHDYKTIELNNVWFASRGYAVLNYSACGHGESGGSIGLASKHLEVRDTYHLISLLVYDVIVNRNLVAAVGGT